MDGGIRRAPRLDSAQTAIARAGAAVVLWHSKERGKVMKANQSTAVAFAMLSLLLAGAPQGVALTLNHNVSFTAVNRNPWTDGPMFREQWVNKDLQQAFTVSVPTVGLSPTALMSDFLGIPNIGFVRAGGVASGNIGLDLGLYVDGGRLNITYPGTGRIDIATRGATGVSTLGYTRTNTSFTPGLYREFKPNLGMVMALLGGPGYDSLNSIPGYETEHFQNPVFKTSFPTAAAWADLHWNLNAGVRVEAGALRLRNPITGSIECVLCTSRQFTANNADSVRLIDINPAGVQVIGLGRQQISGSDIALGYGSVSVSYPNLAVGGGLQAGSTTLFGTQAREIMAFNGNLEQLVPFVGAFLHQGVGPFDLKLLGVEGGPKLSLYQDFTVKVAPKLELNFSRPVEWLSPGGAQITNQIVAPLGQALDWRPIPGAFDNKLVVQPRYLLDGEVRNTTGLALGYELYIDALEADTGLGKVGPVPAGHLQADDALRLPPLYDHAFSLGLGAIKARNINLDVVSPVWAEVGDIGQTPVTLVGGRQLSGDDLGGLFSLTFRIGSHDYTRQVGGSYVRIATAGGRDEDQLLLRLNQALFIEREAGDVRIGDLLCLYCEDNAARLAGSDPFFTDQGEDLYFNPLFSFRSDDIDAGAAQLQGSATALAQLRPPVAVLGAAVAEGDFGFGPITDVPEPASWVLGLAGGLLVCGRRLQRAV
ncbi:hypothetical protein [Roseateles violae]|uniref:PEP-CTERM sorting domain-containing protein n=1 Tax=Roseateles violae TaxID=3058042 RepID=A0ABT8DQJ5_9BURK|nr:hypothetical protein [Pelomonas sp. PFR6]MDN3920607.1 hypothetical protein [Pelomonas sp. PFR6]